MPGVHRLLFQVNGTARPSLALENLQETEKLSGSEREEAEKTIAHALGSMYAGQSLSQ